MAVWERERLRRRDREGYVGRENGCMGEIEWLSREREWLGWRGRVAVFGERMVG